MEKQFVKNIEFAIKELEHEDFLLSKREDFLGAVFFESERHNGRYFANVLSDNLEMEDVMDIIDEKLSSISDQRIQLLAQIDVLEELLEEASQRMEAEGFSEDFFSSLFQGI